MIQAEVDSKELEAFARKMILLEESFPVVCQKMMNAINRELKKDMKNKASSRGYKRSHNFYLGIFAYAGFKNSGFKTINSLYDNAGVGKPKRGYGNPKEPGRGYYAYAIESGHHWEEGAKGPIKIKLKNGWVTLHKIDVPARPFIRATIASWYGVKGSAVMEEEYHKILKKRGIED